MCPTFRVPHCNTSSPSDYPSSFTFPSFPCSMSVTLFLSWFPRILVTFHRAPVLPVDTTHDNTPVSSGLFWRDNSWKSSLPQGTGRKISPSFKRYELWFNRLFKNPFSMKWRSQQLLKDRFLHRHWVRCRLIVGTCSTDDLHWKSAEVCVVRVTTSPLLSVWMGSRVPFTVHFVCDKTGDGWIFVCDKTGGGWIVLLIPPTFRLFPSMKYKGFLKWNWPVLSYIRRLPRLWPFGPKGRKIRLELVLILRPTLSPIFESSRHLVKKNLNFQS